MDASNGGYKCINCVNSLVVSDQDGSCMCPAGRYAKGADDCQDCDKGSYCIGGSFTPDSIPSRTECGASLTTVGKRSLSIKACVNIPGTFYSLDASSRPVASTCPADTYGPGLKKQRACVPCPPGYTTKGLTGQQLSRSCYVSEGYFLKGPGQVAPCPLGEYKSGFDALSACTRCPTGTTTLSQASKSAADCKAVLPGWYPAQMSSGYVTAAEKCPQKFYCPGGVPSQPFSPAALDTTSGTTVMQCPYGTWTQDIGSTGADQCMTPPGYKTTVSGSTGTTDPCADGEYRAEWKPPTAAASCSSCGANIYSSPTDQITQYAPTPDATATTVSVRSSAASCYIKPGQGMYYSAASQEFYVSNCDSNNYGLSNITYGLSAFPCRDCTVGLSADVKYGSSAAYYTLDSTTSPARGGFTSPLACVTLPGYGYNGRVAAKCPVGTWNPAGTLSSCTKCGYGLSTRDDAANQVAPVNCTLAVGFGMHSNAIVPCPVGTFNPSLQNDTTTPCTACPVGSTTSQPGGVDVKDCNICLPGYGDNGNNTGCSTKCGGTNGATYGPAGRDAAHHSCVEYPAGGTGFSFDYLATNQLYTPDPVARLGADSPADCLSEFAQVLDDTWFLGGNATLQDVSGATNFEECVLDCKADAACQYITYSYDASLCQKKVAGTGSDVIAFKAVTAGEVGAASTAVSARGGQRTRAAALASGAYTFWLDNADGIGADTSSSGPTTSVQACLGACDKDGQCTAVVMKGLSATAASQPATCTLVRGDTSPATFKRSMTKAVTTRLNLVGLFASP